MHDTRCPIALFRVNVGEKLKIVISHCKQRYLVQNSRFTANTKSGMVKFAGLDRSWKFLDCEL